ACGLAPGGARPYPDDASSPGLDAVGADDDSQDGDDGGDDGGDDSQGDQGAGVQGAADADQDDDGDGDDPDGADDLGDKGKRALASMKGKWRTEREKRKQLEQQLAEKDGADEAEQ